MTPGPVALVPCLAFLATSAAAIDLPQYGGGQLHLDAPATRIVTLSPHLAELTFLVGAGDRLLATVAYSDFPPEAGALPRIGDAFRFDLERILDLEPDLVIAWDSGNPEAALAAMSGLGLPVWRTEVRSIEDMAQVIRELGRATGLDTEPRALNLEARWRSIVNRHADARTVRYFFQVAERPLYTVNGDHLISRGLDACGARNVFDDLPTLAPQVSTEAVLQENPEVILAGRFEGAADPLAHWREWPRLAAVRDDALYSLPADLINRATPRLLDAVEQACGDLDAYRERRTSGSDAP